MWRWRRAPARGLASAEGSASQEVSLTDGDDWDATGQFLSGRRESREWGGVMGAMDLDGSALVGGRCRGGTMRVASCWV